MKAFFGGCVSKTKSKGIPSKNCPNHAPNIKLNVQERKSKFFRNFYWQSVLAFVSVEYRQIF